MSRVGFVGARSYKNKDLVHNYINEGWNVVFTNRTVTGAYNHYVEVFF